MSLAPIAFLPRISNHGLVGGNGSLYPCSPDGGILFLLCPRASGA